MLLLEYTGQTRSSPMGSGDEDHAPKDEAADELGLVHPCWLYCEYRNILCVLVLLLPSRLDDDSSSRLAGRRHVRRELRGRGEEGSFTSKAQGKQKTPDSGTTWGCMNRLCRWIDLIYTMVRSPLGANRR